MQTTGNVCLPWTIWQTRIDGICKDRGNTQCILDKKENTVIVEPTCEQLETFASPGQFGKLELMVLLNFHLPELVFSTTFGTDCVTIVHKRHPFNKILKTLQKKQTIELHGAECIASHEDYLPQPLFLFTVTFIYS